MERKSIETNIGQELTIDTDYDCGDKPYEISKVISFLETARDAGASHIKITYSPYDYIDIQPLLVRLEYDSEFEKRKDEESRKAQIKLIADEAREKALYLQLKQKYGQQ